MIQPITFPGLGLSFTINPIAFSIFGMGIHWYGIIIGTGFLLAFLLANKDSNTFGIKQNDVNDFLLVVTPLAIIGARLYYVVFEWSYYKNNLLEVFNIHHGGLAIYGGILTAVLTAYVFTKKRKINTLKFFDFFIPYVALGQAIGRWGNFVNQEAHGVETTLPWRMEIFDPAKMQRVAVHPTFLYESLWNLGLFFFLLWFRKKNKYEGEVFMLYLALYGLARFFIEGMRTDSLYIGTLRVSQMLAGLFFIVCIALFFIRRPKNKRPEANS
ncbi:MULTISPECIES: prolipoprotein diacylglyceryl transferase [Dehalobacter]|uniref:Phosphatidylglycerol--prolipoprotein diacylglyceryl transferase n=1 Tax=Dehalobacter restrictus TaxID=55583 RepID=A0A857DF84_9FIRM|nr:MULTISPECIES: prolipoprotein diacylglyceryl transferase [Dehalobacter]EQB22004.1 Prolipoprotein diacylglyceryl transferase [Dehalobacter sp. UNSWDHB]QGZ99181.1 prolipoprotein diacylglyceryl transferase [Dehalobacter restrictus]